MSGTRKKTYLGAAAVLVLALVVGVAVALTTGGKAAPPPSHQAYAQLFANASIGQTTIGVLDDWPKPYQTYHDSYKHQCYEWWDKPIVLYSLCFDRKSKTLVNKDIL